MDDVVAGPSSLPPARSTHAPHTRPLTCYMHNLKPSTPDPHMHDQREGLPDPNCLDKLPQRLEVRRLGAVEARLGGRLVAVAVADPIRRDGVIALASKKGQRVADRGTDVRGGRGDIVSVCGRS